jgi:transcriptional regulator with XRE-family HTH domain
VTPELPDQAELPPGVAELHVALEAVREALLTGDPWMRARLSGRLITFHQDEVSALSGIRREALDELLSAGIKQAQIADGLGMTRARVSKLFSSGPKPARAFLGSGRLTVSIGGKFEGQKTSGASAVISAESLAAYHMLKDLAGAYSLESEYELVPPPGMIDLNRTNLIVMTSPRLLPIVGQVLGADPHLAFESGSRGWFLRDKNTGDVYRSPSDSGASADYAYLGRLPRPDGKGTFLYLAGIHAMGTLGAAQYLTDNLEDLYSQVKTRRWSTIIECRYDPDTRKIESTERIAPVYHAN